MQIDPKYANSTIEHDSRGRARNIVTVRDRKAARKAEQLAGDPLAARTDTTVENPTRSAWWYRAKSLAGGSIRHEEREGADPWDVQQYEEHVANMRAPKDALLKNQEWDRMQQLYGVRPTSDEEFDLYLSHLADPQDFYDSMDAQFDEQLAQRRALFGRDMDASAFSPQPRQSDVPLHPRIDIMRDDANRRLEVYRARADREAQRNGVPGGLPEELLQRIFPDERPLALSRNHPRYNHGLSQQIRGIMSGPSGLQPPQKKSKKN
jgi:hypothetical protein